jgi:predicted ribosomally synthesized peptide with SipW-like signal peptide
LKAKLFLLVLTVVLGAALAGGATMAIFTDTAGNTGNTFAAGTVDIAADRDLGDPLPGPMFYTTIAEGATAPWQIPFLEDNNLETGVWWPGRMVARNLDVRNLGSLQVRLNQVSAAIYSINGQPPTANPALAASFAGNMNVKIYVAGQFVSGQPSKVLYNGSLATLLTGPQTCIHKPLIAPWTGPPNWPPMVQLVYEVTMDIDAGNDLQGIVPVVSFSVFAEQTKNNP